MPNQILSVLLASNYINALHINRHHLELKLQKFQDHYYCKTENAMINADVYPKKLCIKHKGQIFQNELDDNELIASCALKTYRKKPGEAFNDCFCKQGFIESAVDGKCILESDCIEEYIPPCGENEVYGLFIDNEPHCVGSVDVSTFKDDPDVFDEFMKNVFGFPDQESTSEEEYIEEESIDENGNRIILKTAVTSKKSSDNSVMSGVNMDWMPLFSSFYGGLGGTMFDEVCNEPNSPIKKHCKYTFNYDGVKHSYNQISIPTINSGNDIKSKIIMKKSNIYSKESIDNMKIVRGCHCDNGSGRQKPSSQKYWFDNDGNSFKNKCVKVEECGL